MQIISFETSTHLETTRLRTSIRAGASQFRRRGRILRESASGALIRTVFDVSVAFLKPAATCSSPKHEEEEDEILPLTGSSTPTKMTTSSADDPPR